MISNKRRIELIELWLTETNDDEGQDWREDLSQEEKDILSTWDEDLPF